MVAGEQQHQAGEAGVYRAKRWLESTTRFSVPWTVYSGWEQTTATLLNGDSVSYDIAGNLFDAERVAGHRFYGEIKNYTSASDQYPAYQKYLAVSYSSSCQACGAEHDPAIEYMWVTGHPFSLNKYTALCSTTEIEAACRKHEDLLGGEAFDVAHAAQLAKRLWLLIMPARLEEMMMSDAFLGAIRSKATMPES